MPPRPPQPKAGETMKHCRKVQVAQKLRWTGKIEKRGQDVVLEGKLSTYVVRTIDVSGPYRKLNELSVGER